MFRSSCRVFCRNVPWLAVEWSSRKKCILGDFARGSCQELSGSVCICMFSKHVVALWLSMEEFGIQKSINKLHWSVMYGCHGDWWGTHSFRTVCAGKTRWKLPMQMTRDVVRIQHRTFLLGKLPPWKFCLGKPFRLQCGQCSWHAEVLCWADSGIYELCNYPVPLLCPTQGDLQPISDNIRDGVKEGVEG